MYTQSPFFRFISGIAMVSLLSSKCVHADTFNVTSLSDGHGPNTLRGAILRANRLGGHNTIILSPGRYRLTLTGADEDNDSTGDLDINGKLTITTRGNSRATIDASLLGDRVMDIQNAAKVTLENLVITGGTAPGGPNGEAGGGIISGGQLTMKNCVVTGNSGGFSTGRTLDPDGFGGDGGGIYNEFSGAITITTCIISNNTAGSGAVGEAANVISSTATGGDGGAGGDGGGIFNATGSPLPVLARTLVVLNSVGDGGSGGVGGLSDGESAEGPHGNPGSDGTAPDLSGQFATQGHNLIRIGDGSTGITNGIKNDVVGTSGQPATIGL